MTIKDITLRGLQDRLNTLFGARDQIAFARNHRTSESVYRAMLAAAAPSPQEQTNG